MRNLRTATLLTIGLLCLEIGHGKCATSSDNCNN